MRIITPHVPDHVRQLCDAVTAVGPPWVSAARYDSRAFAQLVISQLAPGERALDVGTGTGILAICLAKAGHSVVATDVSRAAVSTAATNAKRNGVAFECYRSDLLDAVVGQFDLIAFNPPYNVGPDMFLTNVAKNLLRRNPWTCRVSSQAIQGAITRFHQKLIGRLARQAPRHLNAGGRLLLHVSEPEASALSPVFQSGSGFKMLRHSLTAGLLIRVPRANAQNWDFPDER